MRHQKYWVLVSSGVSTPSLTSEVLRDNPYSHPRHPGTTEAIVEGRLDLGVVFI